MSITKTLFEWKDMEELRKMLRMEVELSIRLQDELEDKKRALERTQRIADLSRRLVDFRHSEVWKNWKKELDPELKKKLSRGFIGRW